MIINADGAPVYLACGATDLRKSIDGLAALVQQTFALDPFAHAWFVFCNRDRDKLKLLRWERPNTGTGYVFPQGEHRNT